ncbi:hypothetical protein ACP3T3_10805 [Chryseobacterium sp. CBSDS_008]|uniref:hypothetical protein n=1 Tax=Chryseobacterium sp. CBSDS_008 TaxID=3415265 RepID=UPI003CF7EDD6
MKNIYLLLLSFLLISCSFNQFYKDRESDKTDGEKIPIKFYWELRYGKNPDDISITRADNSNFTYNRTGFTTGDINTINAMYP